MKKVFVKSTLAATCLVLGLVFIVPVFVHAEGTAQPPTSGDSNKTPEKTTIPSDSVNKDNTTTSPEPETDTESKKTPETTTTTKQEDRKEVVREKLKDAKLKICTERQGDVNTIMTRVVDRSKAQVERISAVADKAEAFYVKKGNVLSTYDALLADVTSKKATAEQLVNTLTTKATFSCSSDGPKADIASFNTERLAKKTAIDNYRTAVKALIAGIKSVQLDKTTEGGTK